MVRKTISTDRAPQAIGPYSQAVVAGKFIYVSGQIPIEPETGTIVQGGISAQTRQVIENAKAILSAGGYGMEHVVKTTIYLASMDDFGAMNETYAAYFPSEPPARATVEVSRLPKDVSIEVDLIAWKE